MQTSMVSSKQALAGASVPRSGAFQSARSASRSSLVVRAQQGQNETSQSRLIGAIVAAQIALLPLSGAAVADVLSADQLSLGAVGANPAEQFANKSKSTFNKTKSAVAPNPIDALSSKAKSAAQDAKAIAAKGGVAPDPVKSLEKVAKAAKKQVNNPSADFAKKQLKNGGKAIQQAKPAVKKAVNKAKAANPAKDFAQKAEQAKKKIGGGLPLAAIGFNTADLQKEVLFGFGEGKSKVEKAVKEAPSSFSIFDGDSLNNARNKLKENIQQASDTKDDPSERVVSVGKPGESQEENAERIRREAENGNVAGGDARESTN